MLGKKIIAVTFFSAAAAMKVLIFGGTGGCGKEALTRLLERGVNVTAVVRDRSRLPAGVTENNKLTIVENPNGHLALSTEELQKHINESDAVIQALGHTLTFSGVFGKPRDLCAQTAKRVCEGIATLKKQTKFIVISTEGVSRCDGADPPRGCCENCILNCCLKYCLPPHADNQNTMRYIYDHVDNGKNEYVSFCAVRPSDMIDGEETNYTLHKTLQNGIFNAGKSTRANVGKFMADLVTEEKLWEAYKNSYPQILNDPNDASAKAVNMERD